MSASSLTPSRRATAFAGQRTATAVLCLKWCVYLLATVQLVRFYFSTAPGVDIDRYLGGTAPLPFQERILPAVLIRLLLRIPPLVHFLLKHRLVLSPPAKGCALILSCIALGIAGYFCVQLYRAASKTRALGVMVYPLFLVAVVLSYAVHVEQNTYLPYDMPSLAFFSAGLYAVYTRRYVWLVLIVLAGTFNRETTLFLVMAFALDAASIDDTTVGGKRFDVTQIPWLRTLLLAVLWTGVHAFLAHRFAGNDRSENHIRITENLHRLIPENWPVLLNICGYLLPFVLLLWPRIRPRRIGNYALLAVPWFAVMFCYGVITETRIYGELTPFAVVATVLLLEEYLAKPSTANNLDIAGE
jgi:hypothetical protein